MNNYNKGIYIVIGIFILYTLVFSAYVYVSFINFAFNDFYKRLEVRTLIAAEIKFGQPQETSKLTNIYDGYLEVLPSQKEYFIAIDSLEYLHKLTGLSLNVDELLHQKHIKGNQGNLFYNAITYTTLQKQKYAVVVTAENFFYSYHLEHLKRVIISSIIFALFLIVISSLLVKNTLTRPIKNLVNELDDISSDNLHLRLSKRNLKDPLYELTQKLNDILGRLETSFSTQKNFISNASHELNTPLTSIIGEVDLALSKTRTPEQYQTALSNILLEAEKLEKKTKALLLLARTGFNGKSQVMDKIRVDQLIMDVKENIQRINTRFQIKMDFSLLPESPEMLKVKGNEQLLHLALSNILENACKYSDYKTVHVALGATNQSVVIIIKDDGIGIPENELNSIYDPYYRASNAINYEGYGIGLPLSKNIIDMHKGELIIHSVQDQGTTVQVNLPLGNYKL